MKNLLLIVLFLLLLTPIKAQNWDSIPGSDSVITSAPKDMVLFKDKLYIIQTLGMTRKLIVWDGKVLKTIHGWEQLGYTGELGPRLAANDTHLFFFAGKDFTNIDQMLYIAYDGKDFKEIAHIKGLDFAEYSRMFTVFQNDLYYIGSDTSSGTPVKKLYKYDGIESSVVLDNVTKLSLFHELNGSLYARGTIKPGATTLTGILRYDGTAWYELGEPDVGGNTYGNYQDSFIWGGGETMSTVNHADILSVWNGTVWTALPIFRWKARVIW